MTAKGVLDDPYAAGMLTLPNHAWSVRNLAPELLGPTSLRIDGINPDAAVVAAAKAA